jgi:S-adenosylmethionine:tRNA ribosyltransferase-isomerase
MLTDELDYHLPQELIAQDPAERRDASRLLVYRRATGEIEHRRFPDLLDLLDPDDLVVVNTTRVLPVRVHTRRESGGAVELLLLEDEGDGAWEALARPSRRLRAGERLAANGGRLAFAVEEGRGGGRGDAAPALHPPPAGRPRALPDRLRLRARVRRGAHGRSPLHPGAVGAAS